MSLYNLSRDIQTLLTAKKFPLRVTYGPERTQREGYPENLVIFERDREASDTLEAARGVQRNPRKLRTRMLCGVATLYVRNSIAGARVGDHETLCEKFVDALLAALEKWAAATRAIDIPITESRYLSFDERLQAAKEHAPGVDAKACETWPGAVYRVKFQVPRALFDVDYAGAGRPEGTLASPGIASTTNVTGPAGGAPVVGCTNN